MNYNKLTPKLVLNLAAPHTWAASVGPSVFGCVYCFAKGVTLPLWQCFFLVLACILMQSSVNTLNDYIDFVKGTDSVSDNLERSDAVLLYENINPKSALILGITFFAAAATLGIVLIVASHCLIPLWIGLVGALAIFFYSAGKTPISYLPVGELVSGFVMGGLIPMGCAAVAIKRLDFGALLYALPFIISIGLIMMSNNGCDIEKDIKAGRRTLPVVLGREKTKKLYYALAYTWLALVILLPILMYPLMGALSMILPLMISRKAIMPLTISPLDQEHRVIQMKMILKANIIVNSVYTLVIACMAAVK